MNLWYKFSLAVMAGSNDVATSLSNTLSAMNMVGMPLGLTPSALSVATALGLPTPGVSTTRR